MAEGGAQRGRDIEIAPPRDGVDIGRPAAAVLAVDRKDRTADPDIVGSACFCVN